MDLRDYTELLRRRWQTVVLVALLTLIGTALVTFLPTPRYTATAQLFFGVPGGESVNDLAQGSTFTEKQMSSYARVATSSMVLDPVIKQLGLATTSMDLAQQVTATAPMDTVILEIAVTDPDAEQAARIANVVGGHLAAVVGDLVPQRENVQSVRATIFAPALPPSAPSTPRVPLNLAVGSALAIVLGVGIAILRHMVDSKIRNGRDVTLMTDSAILGILPFDASTSRNSIVTPVDPAGPRSEAMRRLRVNLQLVEHADGVKSIVVSSSIPNEGKTTTAVDLAMSIAKTGRTVVLVDADLRRGSLAQNLGLLTGPGLTAVLEGKVRLSDAVQRWEDKLDVLPAGELVADPSELLGFWDMATIVTELSDCYDIVLIDSPPLLEKSDALVLSRAADGALLVIDVNRVRRPQLREALEALSKVDANLLGLVLNNIPQQDASAYVQKAEQQAIWDAPPSPATTTNSNK